MEAVADGWAGRHPGDFLTLFVPQFIAQRRNSPFARKPGIFQCRRAAGITIALIDPCSKFSAADAQSITGVPMKLLHITMFSDLYRDEASPKPGAEMLRVSLTLSVRKSAAEEDRSWNNTRVIRRLKQGEKNIMQLSGIGDEAWFDGHIEKGKVAVGGVLARKGMSDFALESATFSYRSSADEIKRIAKRIAKGLN